MLSKAILIALLFISSSGFFLAGFLLKDRFPQSQKIVDSIPLPKDKTLESYFIESMGEKVKSGNFKIKEEISDSDLFTSNLFEFEFQPNPEKPQTKTTTGVINLPKKDTKSPLIFMIRGYVDQKMFVSGMGTKRSAEYFAENGFITLAPDFLGYGGSSEESGNIFETRFQTYSTVISLHKSLSQIKDWDQKNIFIWAHSNGGQIALTWIAAENLQYPTVLWAPVTKPFPYSVLYYTDESNDGGKLIRRELARLEDNYDVDKFSFTTYFERITNPIQLHQGTADDAIPVSWSSGFVNRLKAQGTQVEYFTYSGDDHNLSENWNTVVQKSLEYYISHLAD